VSALDDPVSTLASVCVHPCVAALCSPVKESHPRALHIAKLDPPLSCRAMDEVLRYSQCTDVQAAAIPACQRGQDVVCKAKTGTGKTLAFLIPAIEQVGSCPLAQQRSFSCLQPKTAPLAVAHASASQTPGPGLPGRRSVASCCCQSGLSHGCPPPRVLSRS